MLTVRFRNAAAVLSDLATKEKEERDRLFSLPTVQEQEAAKFNLTKHRVSETDSRRNLRGVHAAGLSAPELALEHAVN